MPIFVLDNNTICLLDKTKKYLIIASLFHHKTYEHNILAV